MELSRKVALITGGGVRVGKSLLILALAQAGCDVFLRAPFQLSCAFAQEIPSNGKGKIININDARILHPNPEHFAYRLTKRGLEYI